MATIYKLPDFYGAKQIMGKPIKIQMLSLDNYRNSNVIEMIDETLFILKQVIFYFLSLYNLY